MWVSQIYATRRITAHKQGSCVCVESGLVRFQRIIKCVINTAMLLKLNYECIHAV